MGQAITTVIVWLLLGAIINVAVAWGCALWSGIGPEYEGALLQGAGWTRSVPADWPQPEHHYWTSGFGLSGEHFMARVGHEDPDGGTGFLEFWIVAVWSAGWPARSLERVDSLHNVFHAQWILGGLQPPGWLVDQRADPQRRLPATAIWPGFAINTLFYAGVLWLLFAAPFLLRRRRRTRRGLCPKCGYDLRGPRLIQRFVPSAGRRLFPYASPRAKPRG